MTQKTARFFTALIFVCLVRVSLAQDATHLRIEALDRSGLLDRQPDATLSIGADFNGWDPAGTPQSGWLGPEEARVGWYFEVPRSLIERGGAFKFTRGDWGSVEVGSDGAMIENRRTGPIDWDHPGGPVLRCEVHGFEDLNGTQGEPAGQTVVGGVLEVWQIESAALAEIRTVRVWLPETYYSQPDRAFGVFLFHDGQNVFDARTSAFGTEWCADEAATALTEDGAIGAWILVGIDNSGANRSRDYLPLPAGERYPRLPWGGADAYAAFLVDELLPALQARYRVRHDSAHTGLGGSSLGGVVTLHTLMHRPGVFGRALVESPSLWIGDGAFMERIEEHEGDWPERVFLGMGDSETADAANNARHVELTHRAERVLRDRGMGEDRLRTVIGSGQRHNERAWQERLPGAFRFLLSDGKDNNGP